jgi:hypothetical protein
LQKTFEWVEPNAVPVLGEVVDEGEHAG